MTPSKMLYDQLRESRLDFFVSVPCTLLDELIALVANDREIFHTPVTREEEGIGILAGAALAGKRPAILMQNSGLGNSLNALCSLVNCYRLPIILVISHRGSRGEKIEAQMPMGRATERLLEAAEIPCHVVSDTRQLAAAGQVIDSSFEESIPSALLLPYSFWEKGEIK
jgi:sulfopyruvate decarboxylase subunit alpha